MKKILLMIAALMLLTGCVDQRKYDEQVRKLDSLRAEYNVLLEANAALQSELEGYKYAPEKLLAEIRESYARNDQGAMQKKIILLHQYHPDSKEYETANALYDKARKEAAEARARAEAERRAKMAPIERIMEKYGCDEDIATLIMNKQVRRGMTAEQCRASWGRPQDINRTTGSFGVHEQWVYDGYNYLYFEDGILTTIQN